MAKFLSQVYTQIRGKVGGIVYSKNQYAGLIARAFTPPSHGPTEPQDYIRACFDEASIRWQLLDQTERDKWSDYASTCVYTGALGTYSIPGRAMFVSNYSFAKWLSKFPTSSISPDVDPPDLAGFLSIGPVAPGVFAGAASTGIAIDIGNPDASDLCVGLWRSPAFNQTKNVFSGPWPNVNILAADLTPSATTHIEISGLVAGMVYFLKVRAINQDAPHRLSAPFIVRCIAVTNA